ncbi:MAG: hypothetical protein ABI663_18340 [Chryseolinea sp.]
MQKKPALVYGKTEGNESLQKKAMTKNLLFTLLSFIYVTASGQTSKTEDQNLKGWTKETKIVYADFKGKPTDQLRRLNKEVGLQASAQVGLKSVLDVPKKKRDRGRLLEKVYVAPFFIKTTSVTMTKDEKELDKQRLYFDMGEVYARMMRREIEHIQDSAKSYGTIWIMYSSIKDYYCSEFGRMFNDYTYEIFVEKKEGAYEKWRELIDKGLSETDKYATKKEDCHRLLTNLPIDLEYEQSEKVLDSFMRCNK